MHIEPGVVQGAKMFLSYGTAAVSIGFLAKQSLECVKQHGLTQLLIKSFLTTILVFSFFELLPKFPVGISEVHFIFGSTLLLVFGLAPTAIGLLIGLLAQGMLFAPGDLPQYAVNVTTLLAPLFAMSYIAKKIVPDALAYKDLRYRDVLTLSFVYQGGIVSWVAFWAFYGNGFGVDTINAVTTFGLAYLSVILIEPVVDMVVLFAAKQFPGLAKVSFFNATIFEQRLYQAA